MTEAVAKYRAPADLESRFDIEWFRGNRAALDMAMMIARLSNTVDDMIDKDEPVSDAQICDAFLSCLTALPLNPFYASIQREVAPMWVPVFSAFEAATHYERTKDRVGLELAHTLRYMPGMIISYAITVCVGGAKAREYIPKMWKVVANERYDDYLKEHIGQDNA